MKQSNAPGFAGIQPAEAGTACGFIEKLPHIPGERVVPYQHKKEAGFSSGLFVIF